jgi:hypothetical protein
MKASLKVQAAIVLMLSALLSLSVVSQVLAGASYSVKTKPFEGQIKSIKIDKCGLQPGTCEGSVVLAAKPSNEEVTLAIRPGTWLKRGDSMVTIDELGVGNYVKAEAVQIPGQQLQQITILSTE